MSVELYYASKLHNLYQFLGVLHKQIEKFTVKFVNPRWLPGSRDQPDFFSMQVMFQIALLNVSLE